ncbi:MAG: phosphoglucosamine mutase [Candidatus Omnitrophota bacterium]
MQKNKLFGTDGIRGEFGTWPLKKETIETIGAAAAAWLKKKYKARKKICIVIGKDTRESCDRIEKYIAAGFAQAGIEIFSAGVIPTPGLAYLTNTQDFQLGIMISASHNPAKDNGIKFFKHNGYKLTEKEEKTVEKIAGNLLKKKSKRKKISIRLNKISGESYLNHLKNCVNSLNLAKIKIVIDCANGAVSDYAQKIFSELGAQVIVLKNKPNGKNINSGCGSLHPELMAKQTYERKANIGFAFDGDGDRVIFSDEKGNVLDGDYIMAFVAENFLKTKQLKNKIVIGTSMSNFGLEKFLNNIKVKFIRADVGDKYVLKEMIKHKGIFGGEQSGHIIFLDQATTGDGMLTALQLVKMMQKTKLSPSKFVSGLKKYPQLIRNVKVKTRKDFKEMPEVWQRIQKAQKQLRNNGRLVMRYSGTEALARIMVEGNNQKQINNIAESIACAIKKEIGI